MVCPPGFGLKCLPRRKRYERSAGAPQASSHRIPQGKGIPMSKADILRVIDYLAHIVGAIVRCISSRTIFFARRNNTIRE